MKRFLQALEHFWGVERNTKRLPTRSSRVEPLEDRALLSVAPCDMSQAGLFSTLDAGQNEDLSIDLTDCVATKGMASEQVETSYIDVDGTLKTVQATVVNRSMKGEWEAGWYVVNNDVSLTNASISCNGNVNLILADDSSLTIKGAKDKAGIAVTGEENSFTIYGQEEGTGYLKVTGGVNAAGIGGNKGADGENITINGGIVEAKGGTNGAGVGGGYKGIGENVTINDGTVISISPNASGIGSGKGGGTSQDVIISTRSEVQAGANAVKAEVVENDGSDLSSALLGEKYVSVEPSLIETFYIDENGDAQTVNAVVVDSSMNGAWTAGWYVVNSESVRILNASILCDGAVNLILADDCSLTVTGKANFAGIGVSGAENSLTIYGQTNGTGELSVRGGLNAAGIGGGNKSDGENITIVGGIVSAYGGSRGAGVGGGNGGAGANITISGGTVTAEGGLYGAGVGGGYQGTGENIKITNGELDAQGGASSAGIGGGYRGVGQDVSITGGMTVAVAGGRASGVGSGASAEEAVNIIINQEILVTAGTNAYSASVIENNGSDLEELEGLRYVSATSKIKVSYLDSKGNTQEVFATIVDGSMKGDWSAGWYVVRNNVTMTNASITCKGDVNLILSDDCSLTVTGANKKAGINVTGGNSLTIYGQTQGNGSLTVTGGKYAAGIGGNQKQTGENITINGGTITAKGGYEGAGIGGGDRGNGQSITINRGTVNTKGGQYASGIGGGYCKLGRDITINGGKITANGGEGGAGIGGGYRDQGKGITITGGDITAKGGRCGAGIGGGGSFTLATGKNGESIFISGGNIKAYGGDRAAGIGGGGCSSIPHGGDCKEVRIEGGVVYAEGGYRAAGIGGGNDHGNCSNVHILNATVTAKGKTEGAGIGSSYKGAAEHIIIDSGVVNAYGGSQGAGIGSGYKGTSDDIKINGGVVTALGGLDGYGIGPGEGGTSYHVYVSTNQVILAGYNAATAREIKNDGGDLADELKLKRYVKISPKPEEPDSFDKDNSLLALDDESFDELNALYAIPSDSNALDSDDTDNLLGLDSFVDSLLDVSK